MSYILDVLEAEVLLDAWKAKPAPPPHVKAASDYLEGEFRRTSKALGDIPGATSGLMGLPPEHLRLSPEFRAAKQKADDAFQALRNFNKQHAKKYDWRKLK